MDHPLFPPVCALVIVTFLFHSFIDVSFVEFTLLASVMPLSFKQFSFCPFPLQSLIVSPSSQLWGMFSVMWIFSIMVLSSCFGFLFASMKI